MKSRILDILKYKNIGQAAFEKNVGLSNGYVNNVKSTIGADKIVAIIDKYPEIDLWWLLTGKGEMLNNNQHLENVNNSVAIGRDANGSKITIEKSDVDEFIKITEKYQSQIDRLLSIIEKLKEKWHY